MKKNKGLKMGAVNLFYNQVNQYIHTYAETAEIFKKIEEEKKQKQPEAYSSKVPSLFKLSSAAIQNEMIDLSREEQGLQIKFLEEKTTFTDWRESHFFCLPANSTKVTGKIIKHLGVESEKPDHAILKHLFEKMYAAASEQTRTTILTLKRPAQPITAASKNYVREVAEKVVQFISNRKFVITLGVGVAIFAFIGGIYAVYQLRMTASLIINAYANANPTFLKIVTFIKKYDMFIFFGAIVAESYTRSRYPRMNKWIFKPLENIALLTWGFSGTVGFIVSVNITLLYSRHIPLQQMKQLASKWNDLRLGHEYVEARELWIQLCLNERAAKRAETEYDYAVNEVEYCKTENLPTQDAEAKLTIAQANWTAAQKLLLPA